MLALRLSPENPLARDGRLATRSVARARTTDHLAVNTHRAKRIRLTANQSQMAKNAKNRYLSAKKQIPDYGFFAGVAVLDAAAGALVSSVADLMVSSLGQPLST